MECMDFWLSYLSLKEFVFEMVLMGVLGPFLFYNNKLSRDEICVADLIPLCEWCESW
jgi:hypothetical protein